METVQAVLASKSSCGVPRTDGKLSVSVQSENRISNFWSMTRRAFVARDRSYKEIAGADGSSSGGEVLEVHSQMRLQRERERF